MLGNIAISENQRISKKNLSNLRFVPRNSNECEATFYFSPDTHRSGAYPCTVYLLERKLIPCYSKRSKNNRFHL